MFSSNILISLQSGLKTTLLVIGLTLPLNGWEIYWLKMLSHWRGKWVLRRTLIHSPSVNFFGILNILLLSSMLTFFFPCYILSADSNWEVCFELFRALPRFSWWEWATVEWGKTTNISFLCCSVTVCMSRVMFSVWSGSFPMTWNVLEALLRSSLAVLHEHWNALELIILGFSWFKQVNFFFIKWERHSSAQLSKYLLYSIESGGKKCIYFSAPAYLGKGAVFWLSSWFNWNSRLLYFEGLKTLNRDHKISSKWLWKYLLRNSYKISVRVKCQSSKNLSIKIQIDNF